MIIALQIHCSAQCKELLDELAGYTLEERGLVTMKVSKKGRINKSCIVIKFIMRKSCIAPRKKYIQNIPQNSICW